MGLDAGNSLAIEARVVDADPIAAAADTDAESAALFAVPSADAGELTTLDTDQPVDIASDPAADQAGGEGVRERSPGAR